MGKNPTQTKRIRFREGIVSLLNEPERAFQKLKKEPDFILPILFILLTAVISLLIIEYSHELMKNHSPIILSIKGPPHRLLGALTGAVVGLFLWLLKTLLYYGIAALLGGHGSLKGALSIIGYTYLAPLLEIMLSTATLLMIGAPISLGLGLFVSASEQLFTIKGLILSSVNLFEILLILMTTIGLAVAMDLTTKKSLIIALFFWVLRQGLSIGFAILSLKAMAPII